MHSSKWHRYSINSSASCWSCNGTSRPQSLRGPDSDGGVFLQTGTTRSQISSG